MGTIMKIDVFSVLNATYGVYELECEKRSKVVPLFYSMEAILFI